MTPAVVELQAAEDVVEARRAGRDLARSLGFGVVDQTRLATAISEIARNAVEHGGGGSCRLQDASDSGELCVRVCIEDRGPGIADVEQAMRDGFSTGSGLGAGLPGTRRLMQRFRIEANEGPGISVCFELRRRR